MFYGFSPPPGNQSSTTIWNPHGDVLYTSFWITVIFFANTKGHWQSRSWFVFQTRAATITIYYEIIISCRQSFFMCKRWTELQGIACTNASYALLILAVQCGTLYSCLREEVNESLAGEWESSDRKIEEMFDKRSLDSSKYNIFHTAVLSWKYENLYRCLLNWFCTHWYPCFWSSSSLIDQLCVCSYKIFMNRWSSLCLYIHSYSISLWFANSLYSHSKMWLFRYYIYCFVQVVVWSWFVWNSCRLFSLHFVCPWVFRLRSAISDLFKLVLVVLPVGS